MSMYYNDCSAMPMEEAYCNNGMPMQNQGFQAPQCWQPQQLQHEQPAIGCYGTVVVNGAQMIKCGLPHAGCHMTMQVPVEEGVAAPLPGRTGAPLDILFVVPHEPANAYAWQATMSVAYEAADGSIQQSVVDLGSIARAGGSSHVAHDVAGIPMSFSISLAHELRCAVDARSPLERQLVQEVVAILENPRLNKEQGSLSSVLINNKAKESVLYERVVGLMYNKSWSDFLRAHSTMFTVFYYNDAEIRERDLAPHIKRSDARVHLAGRPARQVHAGDQARCAALRAGEEDLKSFLTKTLEAGDLSQRDLLARLKHCKGFTDSLFPTSSLLMRFLSCHRDAFSWTSEPDQPTRIQLVEPSYEQQVLSGLATPPSILSNDETTPAVADFAAPHTLTVAVAPRECALDDYALATYRRSPRATSSNSAASAPDADQGYQNLDEPSVVSPLATASVSSLASTPGQSYSTSSLPDAMDARSDNMMRSYRHDPYDMGGYVYAANVGMVGAH